MRFREDGVNGSSEVLSGFNTQLIPVLNTLVELDKDRIQGVFRGALPKGYV